MSDEEITLRTFTVAGIPLDVAEIVEPEEPDDDPDGATITCTNCGRTERLPSLGGGRVSIAPIIGWTFPPSLCPDCTTPSP